MDGCGAARAGDGGGVVYGHDFACKICGYLCDSDREVYDGLRVCTDCIPPERKHRLWRWQEAARSQGLYDLPRVERCKVAAGNESARLIR